MRLRVLGSAGIYPTADNPSSGFLLDGAGARIWLDAGTGTFAALQAVEDPTALSAVVLSHGHADHCLDLFPLHYALLLHPEGSRRLPLYCPSETWRRLLRFHGKSADDRLEQSFDFHAVDAGEKVVVEDVELTFQRTDHPGHTLAVRAACDAGVVAYTSDTGPGVDLVPFVRRADILLCEATYQRDHGGRPVHLSAEEAGALAQQAEVGELVLTHIGPQLDPARSREEARSTAQAIPVSVARPGKVYQVLQRG